MGPPSANHPWKRQIRAQSKETQEPTSSKPLCVDNPRQGDKSYVYLYQCPYCGTHVHVRRWTNKQE